MTQLDWSKLIICGTADCALKYPASQHDGKGSQVYKNFMENVRGFKKPKSLPVRICFDDDVTANDLTINCAKWHKNCYLLFAKSKLLRHGREQLGRGMLTILAIVLVLDKEIANGYLYLMN